MSWLTWWKKDKKEDNQEEESEKKKKKINIIGAYEYIGYDDYEKVTGDAGSYTFYIKATSSNKKIQRVDTYTIMPVPGSVYDITHNLYKIKIVVRKAYAYNADLWYIDYYMSDGIAVQYPINSEKLSVDTQHIYTTGEKMEIIVEKYYYSPSKGAGITMTSDVQQLKNFGTREKAYYMDQAQVPVTIQNYVSVNGYSSNSDLTFLRYGGEVPYWFYEKLLPFSTKGYVDNNGYPTTDKVNGHHIISLNDLFYNTKDPSTSSMNFGRRLIDLSVFEDFYVTNITISGYYKDKTLPFKYWNMKVLLPSIITYLERPEVDIITRIDNTTENGIKYTCIHIKDTPENNFLDSFIENGTLSFILDDIPELNEQYKVAKNGASKVKFVIDEYIVEDENNVNIRFFSETFSSLNISYTDNGEQQSSISSSNLSYRIQNIYCINTSEISIDNIPEINLTINPSNTDYNLNLTNYKSDGTQNTEVNVILNGDLTEYYTNGLPEGINTINAPPAPGYYLEGESIMDLSNVNDLDLKNFGELDEDGKFINQKIYLSKIKVKSKNEQMVKDSEMMSSNKLPDKDDYAPTEVIGVIVMDDTIPTNVTYENGVVQIQLYEDNVTKEPDFMNEYVDNKTLYIKLDDKLSAIFNNNPDGELELYLKTMNIKNNNQEIEFYSSDVNSVTVYYTGNDGDTSTTYESGSFTTHLGTLNITYTEGENNSLIKPITYSSNGNVKAVGLQTKESGINKIDTVNSINTIVTGNTITQNRITLVNNGLIPKKMYKDNLPINDTNKRYVKSDGTIVSSGIARLVAINEPPKDEYLTYKSSMNLIDVTNVDISKFGTIKKSSSDPNLDVLDKQNVFLSSILVYDNEVNKKVGRAGLMSRNEVNHGRTLGDGETPVYAPTDVDYQRDDIVNKIENKTILTINEQNCNNFLKSVTETEGGTETIYTDIYLNATCSSSFRENSKNTLRVSILYLLNEYTITFNGEENMGNLRIHYLKSNPEEGDKVDDYGYVEYVPSNPTYEVVNLYIASGEYEEDTSNLIPHPVEWTDGNDDHKVFNRTQENGITTSISLDLQYKHELTYVVSVSTRPYCINTLVSNQDYVCDLIVSGEIPQWVFKDLLPLSRYIGDENVITGTDTGKCLLDINRPLEDYVGISLNSSTECMIDLTNVADPEIFNRTYLYGEKTIDGKDNEKVFFVNKVKLLKRFEGKIDTSNDPLFVYYDGRTLKPSVVEFVDDWALKLPECYESCEVSGIELTVKFGEYLQIDYVNWNSEHVREYLFSKLLDEDDHYYLDLSMKIDSDLSNIILNNITTLKIYLDILKYISWSNVIKLLYNKKVEIIFNINGFLESKEISEDNIKQEINSCYVIYETVGNLRTLDRDNILIKPDSNVFSSEGNIRLHDSFYIKEDIVMQINYLKCTNIYQMNIKTSYEKMPPNTEVNLLVSSKIPKWLGEYFYSENKALPIRVKSGRNGICELAKSDGSTDVSADYFMITSINDMPAPGIGIANSDPNNQCSLNLEDFINPPEP